MASRRRPSRGQRVRLRLTVAGWLFLLVTMVVSAAAVKSQSAMLFVMVGAMLGAVLASSLMARRALRAVEVTREIPSHAWQNETVHVGYYLRNSRKRPCLALSLEELPAADLEGTAGFCAHLPAKGTFRSGSRFVVRQRGRVVLKGVRLTTRFPLGLVAARRIIRDEASLVVWPARGWLTQRLLHQGAVEISTGPPTQATGGQDEFFGLRDYRSDDNPRWIHWRRSADRPVPVVREMCRPRPEMLYVILDTHLADDSPLAWSRRERMIRLTGTLIEHALSRGYQVGLALSRDGKARAYPAAAGRGQLHLLLTTLADIDGGATLPVVHTLASVQQRSFAEAQVVVVTTDPAAERQVPQRLRSACRNVTVITDSQVSRMFADNPLAAAQEAN